MTLNPLPRFRTRRQRLDPRLFLSIIPKPERSIQVWCMINYGYFFLIFLNSQIHKSYWDLECLYAANSEFENISGI